MFFSKIEFCGLNMVVRMTGFFACSISDAVFIYLKICSGELLSFRVFGDTLTMSKEFV
jgi:hypothetical protein